MPLGLSDGFQSKQVQHLSGGELQRVAIAVCLGTPASVFMLDEPSAFLDVEQRLIVAKVIRSWVLSHLGRSAVLIEHDLLMASALGSRAVVFSGTPGTACAASAPAGLADGFNAFLKGIDVTIRRDPTNLRPRINKRGGGRDREQKAENKHFVFACDGE
jgi:ATP-binding cassette subfamily E protein 1